MFKRQRGQTLIEVMVVIAIIAILAAILFPVFAKAKDSAQRRCAAGPATELTIEVRSATEDFVPGREPVEPGYKQPGSAGELFTLYNTDKGMLYLYKGFRWKDHSNKDQVVKYAEVKVLIAAQKSCTVLVASNVKGEKVIVDFVKAIAPEPTTAEDRRSGTLGGGTWSFKVPEKAERP